MKNWLCLARTKAGMTQCKLAERTGIKQQSICAYEHGRWPSRANMKALWKVLKFSIEDVLK